MGNHAIIKRKINGETKEIKLSRREINKICREEAKKDIEEKIKIALLEMLCDFEKIEWDHSKNELFDQDMYLDEIISMDTNRALPQVKIIKEMLEEPHKYTSQVSKELESNDLYLDTFWSAIKGALFSVVYDKMYTK